MLGHSARTALTVALGLAQIGEFSFILSELARKHGLMPDAGHNVLVAAAILSITLNPLLFRSLDPIEALAAAPAAALGAAQRPRRAAGARGQRGGGRAGRPAASRRGSRLAVVVGFGPVGRSVDRLLRDAGLTTVVIDMNMDTVAELQRQGQAAIFGDASREAILEQAGVRPRLAPGADACRTRRTARPWSPRRGSSTPG